MRNIFLLILLMCSLEAKIYVTKYVENDSKYQIKKHHKIILTGTVKDSCNKYGQVVRSIAGATPEKVFERKYILSRYGIFKWVNFRVGCGRLSKGIK